MYIHIDEVSYTTSITCHKPEECFYTLNSSLSYSDFFFLFSRKPLLIFAILTRFHIHIKKKKILYLDLFVKINRFKILFLGTNTFELSYT